MTAVSNYTFLPWARKGLANLISNPDPNQPGLRPSIPVTIDLKTDNAALVTPKPGITVEILGPGDIIGIQTGAISNTRPKADVQNFEPYLLAAVEFYEEDFLWRYTPLVPDVGASEKLIPWLTLLVLETGEYNEGLNEANVRTVTVPVDLLPNPDDLWAWGHIQVNQNLTGIPTSNFLTGDLAQNGDLAFSRLFSPRHLKEYTQYQAFLVPTFKAGCLAGLNQPVTAVPIDEVAWKNPGALTEIDFPVYYTWSFKTGQNEDFEHLARQLKPTALTSPSWGLAVDVSDLDYDLQVLSGMEQVLLPSVIELPNTSYNFQYQAIRSSKKLHDLLDRGFTYDPFKFNNIKPIVVPPTFGRYYANLNQFPFPAPPNPLVPNWIIEANLDLRYRAITAIGSKIIQQRQDEFAQKAWEQLKDVLEANRNLKYMQAGLRATASLREQNLPVNAAAASNASARMAGPAMSTSSSSSAMEDYGVQLAAPILSRIKGNGGNTLYQQLRDAKFPLAAVSSTFRRLNRPFGNFQVNQAGPPAADETVTVQTLLEPGATLQQRDSLLTLLSQGESSPVWPLQPPQEGPPMQAMKFSSPDLQALLEDLQTNGWEYDPENPEMEDYDKDLILEALQDINAGVYEPFDPDNELQLLDLEDLKANIIAATDPEPVFLARANKAIRFLAHYPEGDIPQGSLGTGDAQPDGGMALRTGATSVAGAAINRIAPLMAYPVFKEPMYEALKAYNEELILPGVGNLPENVITLMQVNDRFVEAFMLGLNHEMASELLWREYPTDQRGSYFRQFWDKKDLLTPQGLTEEQLKDIMPVDKWLLSSELGTHANTVAFNPITTGGTNPNPGGNNDLILLIKGELLRKFPNIAIYAQRAKLDNNKLVPDESGAMRFPIQRAELAGDTTILRFSLSAEQATGAADNSLGWFFLLVERPGEPAFGLDIESEPLPSLDSWDNLSWSHTDPDFLNPDDLRLTTNPNPPLPTETVTSVNNGAKLAYAVFQKPAMVAIHANQMIANL